MHELSIVMSIVDSAREQVAKYNAARVERIGLEIGTLAGIEPDALEFAWEAAVPGTVLEGAERHIHYVQARAKCAGCGNEFDIQQLFEPCPLCGEYFSDLLQGQELRIKTMTLLQPEPV
ncbi:MAG: hydrogenase maturation nickel metallochaperone HypA [Phaeodactylibacter sp.]|nr:hydrogenase maturation nickel metallochaperone HypA [Phaeodactylibacter sp.]MCB9286786.1 hydrogenase maturation nickel metallochaperone HypA [Lewinellaceae bacterium]